ncbi:hypothetical protein A9Q96_03390 [Rhodobacterales bacterium 52_120_T64]|nr:hypothetical protein A9Q96_03390 [Rhodobacterales bacterium 52_120_T64]
MRLFIPLAVLIIATPAFSQELDLDFDSFGFDENSEITFDTLPETGMEVSATVSLSYSGIGALNQSSAAQISLANEHSLGTLGFLEWAANATIIDYDIEFDLSRIHLQNSTGNFSWKLGKYRIGWGEIEGAPVLDVVNALLSFGDVNLSSDELPGQWFIGLDYFASSVTVSSFLGIVPGVSHAIPATDSTDIEVGIKASLPIESGSVNLYAARLVPQSGVVDIHSDTSHATPYVLAGFSTNRSFGDMLFEVDVASKFGLQRSTATALSYHNRIDAALGVEYAASNTMQVTAAVSGQHWLEQSEDYFEFDGYLSTQNAANYIVGVSEELMDGKLSVSANILGTLNNNVNVTALSASYSYSDRLEFGASAMWLSAETGAQFEAMDGYEQYGLTSKFHF